MQKIDKKTGKKVTYSNATFALYKKNDNDEWERVKCKVGNKYLDTWTTDETGLAITETKIKAGVYKLEELIVPFNFVNLDEELIFTINNENETIEYDQDFDATITVTVGNEQPTRQNIIK